ncbi:MAG: tyrosine-type recombinase/integrase [Planctomycetota bacterium]
MHDFRRAFGTRWARAGCPVFHLMKLMRHRNIATTQKFYLHLDAQHITGDLRRLGSRRESVPQVVPDGPESALFAG